MVNTPNLEIYLTKTQEINLLKGHLASLQNIIVDLEEENKILKDAVNDLKEEVDDVWDKYRDLHADYWKRR